MPINPEDDMEQSASQTSSARERGFTIDRTKQDFGEADDDRDGAGDIADEGAAHRDAALPPCNGPRMDDDRH